MADIFEVKAVDAKVSVPALSKEFVLHDPNMLKKIDVHRKFNALREKRATMEHVDFMEKAYRINCEQIRLYLPDMTETDFDVLGESAFAALLDMLTDIAGRLFGAKVEKIGEAVPGGK